tara:strand:- start:267 stop:434 length:168 start_codon:yes stop_codon:yes gene_type:complete
LLLLQREQIRLLKRPHIVSGSGSNSLAISGSGLHFLFTTATTPQAQGEFTLFTAS